MCGWPQSGLGAARFQCGARTTNWNMVAVVWACLLLCFCAAATTSTTVTTGTESAPHRSDPTRPIPSPNPATTKFPAGGKRQPRPTGSSSPTTKTKTIEFQNWRRQRQKSQPPGLCHYEPSEARLTCSGADDVTNELVTTSGLPRTSSGPLKTSSGPLEPSSGSPRTTSGPPQTVNPTSATSGPPKTGFGQLHREFEALTTEKRDRIESVWIEYLSFDTPLNLSALLTYFSPGIGIDSPAVGRPFFPQLRHLVFYRNSFASVSMDNATDVDSSATARPIGAAATNSKVEWRWPSSSVELDQLRDFQLIGNNVTSLSAAWTLRLMPQLTSLTINDNRLTALERDAFSANQLLVNISMAGNNWSCQEMEWFLVWARQRPLLAFADKGSTVCEHYDGKATGRTTFGNLLDLCPANCSCHLMRALVEVDCRQRGFYSFPPVVPVNTSILHMENNSIASLESILEGKNYAKLRFFYVDNNSIESLNFLERTDFYNGMVALHISGNRLSRVPVYAISRLTDLKLGRNPWRCECDAVSPFYDFLMSRAKDIRDVDDIRCADDGSVIHRAASKHKFCYHGEDAVHPLDVLNACLVMLILLVILNVMYDYTIFQLTGRMPRGPCCYNLVRSACPRNYKPLSTGPV